MATAALTVLGLLAPAAGHADPAPSVHHVRAQVARLEAHAQKVDEHYDAAAMHARKAQHQLAEARATMARQRHKVAAQGRRIAAVAASLYRAGPGGGSIMALLVSGGPQKFIERASTASVITRRQADVMHAYERAEHHYRHSQHAAREAAKQATARKAAVRRQKHHVEALLHQRRHLLSRLTAQQQARLKRQRAARAAAARAQRTSLHASPAVSGSSSGAVGFARAQLGKPYAWGASGPGSYDCSGLTMAAWRAAGVSLPHNAAAQYAATRHISMSQLRPGDLVFRGSPAYHVGVYIGGGRVIDAPHTGASVRIGGLGYYQYAAHP
jgi:cell wall-associated NlpC family hydrolase